MTSIYLGGRQLRLRPEHKLGEGGEAEVYDLGDGTVVKWFKPPAHPDFAGDAAARAQVASRLAEHQDKLVAFPAGLPPQVVPPRELGYADRKRRVITGYQMAKVSGTSLHLWGEPRWRRDHGVANADAIAPLLDLYDAVNALHQRGVVLGDFNDLNVLVDGARVHLIDADSYQFGGFPCLMYSERFVDPRLCRAAAAAPAADALRPVAPHDIDSDWFAFHAMVTRTLLLVGPWGGVHQPADPSARCKAAARPLRRITVFDPDVIWPRAATSARALPDELVAALQDTFHGDRRGPLRRELLSSLRFVRCARCGLEHARARCPECAIPRPAPAHHGDLQVTPLERSAWLEAHRAEVPRLRPGEAPPAAAVCWMKGDALWRRGALGPARVGGVLAEQTRAWVAESLGAGWYRAGSYTVAFVFDPRRGVLDDRVRLPALRGELVAAHAALAEERAWLWFTLAREGRLILAAAVLDRRGELIAAAELAADEEPWHAGLAGACAHGPALFVPTDAGVVRVELDAGRLTVARTFPETAPWVCSADRLAIGPGGLEVLRRDDAVRLSLS